MGTNSTKQTLSWKYKNKFVLIQSRNSPHFMQPDGSLPCF